MNITVLDIDTIVKKVGSDDPAYDKIYTISFNLNTICVPVHNPDLADALIKMPGKLRTIILRHEVLKHRLKDIAKDIGVSERTICSYRSKALESLRTRMANKQ